MKPEYKGLARGRGTHVIISISILVLSGIRGEHLVFFSSLFLRYVGVHISSIDSSVLIRLYSVHTTYLLQLLLSIHMLCVSKAMIRGGCCAW